MTSIARKLVSKNKRRFGKDGFDLDLTYITPRIIAMGFPSENIEGVYRNPMSEVVRFLDLKHPGRYRVYNLCSERSYDKAKFHGRVEEFPFEDHNAPPIELIKPFCENVKTWLSADPENVIVVHCKAGKGRTGVMICCYLIHDKVWETADKALDYYGAYRTRNSKGVTIPSQIRYVNYYAELVEKSLTYEPRTVFLTKLTLSSVPKMSSQGCSPIMIINKRSPQGTTKTYTWKPVEAAYKTGSIDIVLPTHQPLCGDMKIEFYHKEKFKQPQKMFHFWFNTFFLRGNSLILKKSELDKANKDKKHANFDENFTVTMEFNTFMEGGVELAESAVNSHGRKISDAEDLSIVGDDDEDLSDDDTGSIMSDYISDDADGSVELT